MSIFDAMFGGNKGSNTGGETGQAPANQAPTGQASAGSDPASQPNGGGNQDPQNPQSQSGGQSGENKLDSFLKLYQNNNSQGETNSSSMRIPQDKLREVSGTMDFMKDLPPEVMTRIKDGDMTAFGEALNHVGRQAYAMSMDHSTGVADHHLTSRFKSERELSDRNARVSTVDSQLNVGDLPAVAQSMFRDTASRIASQNPTLSAKQVEENTWELMQEFSDQFNRKGKQQTQQRKSQEIDYDDFGDWSKSQ